MFVPPRLPPLVTENNYSQPLNTQEGGIEQEADTGNSKELNTRVFYKNTFFEIHIAQSLFLVFGPIEIETDNAFSPNRSPSLRTGPIHPPIVIKMGK